MLSNENDSCKILQKHGWTLQIVLRKDVHCMIPGVYSSNTGKLNQWWCVSGRWSPLWKSVAGWCHSRESKRLVMSYLSRSWLRGCTCPVCETALSHIHLEYCTAYVVSQYKVRRVRNILAFASRNRRKSEFHSTKCSTSNCDRLLYILGSTLIPCHP